MSDFSTLPSQQYVPPLEDRTLSRQYEPSSVKNASLRLIYGTGDPATTVVTIANNAATTFLWLISNDGSQDDMLSYTNYEVYIGDTSDLENLLPGGNNINHGGWRMLGPIKTPYDINGRFIEDWENMDRLTIINTSGSSAIVTIRRFSRTVINNPAGVSGATN